MKILELTLASYGPFSGALLDLSEGDHGLHLILGANEAGKTSAMRALNALLFGFPAQSPDGFLHGYDRLRVGATLRHSDGETLEILRRKGIKNTLRGADDLSIVAEEALTRFLGGIDQRTFESLFSLNHVKLAAGADEIGEGKGLLGETLFAAGTGLSGLKRARTGIGKQLDELFKVRGKTPKINAALASLREAKEDLKKAQLPGEDWIRQDAELTRCRLQAYQFSERLDRLRNDREFLIRTRSAIPQVARWRRIRAEIEALGAVVRLRDGFGDEARSALEDVRSAEEAIARSMAAREELDREFESIAAPGPILDAEAEVESILKRLGAIEKAAEERERLTRWAAEEEYKAKEILRKLGKNRDLAEAEALRSLRDDELAAIRALGQRESGLRAKREEAALAISERALRTSRLVEDRARLGEPIDAKSLRAAVQKARKAGDLDDRLAKAKSARDRRAKDGAKALGSLPNWSGDLDSLERIAVPLDPTIDRFEGSIRESEKAEEKLREKITEGEDALAESRAQLSAIDRSLDVPTEADLRDARARRDEGWRLVRSAANGAIAESFTNEFAPGLDLADAFERAQKIADDLSDRLRREADQVALKAELIARIEGQKASIDRWYEELSAARDRAELRRGEWLTLVVSIGLLAQSPAELRAWLSRRADVLKVAELARDADREWEEADRALAEQFERLGRALEGLGIDPPPLDEGFRAWAELAEEVLAKSERDERRRLDLDTRIADARVEADLDRVRLESAEENLAAWKADWAAKLDRLGYEAGMTPAQAETILSEMQAVGEIMTKYRSHIRQLAAIARDAEAFDRDVEGLAGRVLPDLGERSSPTRIQEMSIRLKKARSLDQKRSDLRGLREAEAVRLREAEARWPIAKVTLDRLRKEARCDSIDGLIPADDRSRELARLETDLRATEEGLRASAAGKELEAFAEEVDRRRAEDLAPEIGRIDGEIAAIDAELGGVKEAMGLAQGELRRMDGGNHSAEAAESSQAILAQLQGDVARFATLKLADSILRRGIDRYREKNQGPILARAGDLFSTLTGGSFARLQIDDDEGQAVLQGVRPDGSAVIVAGLSDGSRDQLYLALRIASLESWLKAHEPIPLVVDDLLLSFDDDRALAALRALTELSRQTQILFFTHHRHLVEIAEANLPADVLFRHDLDHRVESMAAVLEGA